MRLQCAQVSDVWGSLKGGDQSDRALCGPFNVVTLGIMSLRVTTVLIA